MISAGLFQKVFAKKKRTHLKPTMAASYVQKLFVLLAFLKVEGTLKNKKSTPSFFSSTVEKIDKRFAWKGKELRQPPSFLFSFEAKSKKDYPLPREAKALMIQLLCRVSNIQKRLVLISILISETIGRWWSCENAPVKLKMPNNNILWSQCLLEPAKIHEKRTSFISSQL